MFVSLLILLTSHKQIFFYVPKILFSLNISQTDIFYVPKLLFSSPLTNRYFFMFPRYYSPSISHKRKDYVCSLSARPFSCSFSLHLSISSLSLSAHFPLSCLLARLFLHSLPTLFHFHICIFTSPSLYIFSLTLRTLPPLLSSCPTFPS